MMEPIQLRNAKVLVAGGSGFIGGHLIRRLREEGCHVRTTRHVHDIKIPVDDVEIVSADLRDMNDCRRAVEDVKYVFMCAAVTSGAAMITATPLAHVTPNVVANAQILDAAYHAGVKKFAFVSSAAAYPPTGERPVTEDEMFDDDEINGVSVDPLEGTKPNGSSEGLGEWDAGDDDAPIKPRG